MRISETYSHLNGEEFLMVRRPGVLEEIQAVIADIDAEECRTKLSKEARKKGRYLFSPEHLNAEFKERFRRHGWESVIYHYFVTTVPEYVQETEALPLQEQRRVLAERGVENPPRSYKQTDFVKDAVAIEVQFGKYAFVAYDLFVKHLLFFSGRIIDIGVEILPMKAMQEEMSSGIAYYEGEVYNVLRHGRTSPPVPLLIIGIEP